MRSRTSRRQPKSNDSRINRRGGAGRNCQSTAKYSANSGRVTWKSATCSAAPRSFGCTRRRARGLPAGILDQMKIRQIKPFLVDRSLLVRVYTDAGIVGTGEAGLWAHHKLVYDAINQLSGYYIGKDAGRIDHHFQVVSRDTHFQGAVLSAAMSAIDIALWDILGKSVGKPVHQLLGGKLRDKVKVFGSVAGATLDERAKQAAALVAQGYQSLRTIPFFDGWEQRPSSR